MSKVYESLQVREAVLNGEYLSFDETVRSLGIAHSTLEKIVARKQIPVLRVWSGRRAILRLFKKSDVLAFALERMKFEPGPQEGPRVHDTLSAPTEGRSAKQD